MSDEFIAVATQEILEDISKIQEILESCKNDKDVHTKAKDIQGRFHKIKGLAPMMGKEHVGTVATKFDSLMKQILNDATLDGIYDSLINTLPTMKKAMTESDLILESLEHQLSSKFS